MGSISNAKAIHGLTASGTPASTNVSGTVDLGPTYSRETLTGADLFYSLTITSTGASDVATLDLTDGTVAQTTGTPTITDGDGNDFEGVTLGTLASISAVHFAFTEVAAGTIVVACDDTNLPDITASVDGHKNLTLIPAGKTLSGTDVVVTFDDATSQSVTITVAGKTS